MAIKNISELFKREDIYYDFEYRGHFHRQYDPKKLAFFCANMSGFVEALGGDIFSIEVGYQDGTIKQYEVNEDDWVVEMYNMLLDGDEGKISVVGYTEHANKKYKDTVTVNIFGRDSVMVISIAEPDHYIDDKTRGIDVVSALEDVLNSCCNTYVNVRGMVDEFIEAANKWASEF